MGRAGKAPDRAAAQLEELRLRVMAAAEDVAGDEGGTWPPGWPTTGDPIAGKHGATCGWYGLRTLRWQTMGRALREREANRAQAEVIVGALEALPGR